MNEIKLPPYKYGRECGPNEKVLDEAAVRQAVREAVIERCERESGVCVMVHDKDSKTHEPCDASNCRSMRGHSASLGLRDAVPEGFVMVPLVMTKAMRDVTDEDGWQWEDLLAASESITEDEYSALAAAQEAKQ